MKNKEILLRIARAMEELVAVVKGHLPSILATLESIEKGVEKLERETEK